MTHLINVFSGGVYMGKFTKDVIFTVICSFCMLIMIAVIYLSVPYMGW
jgi:hypothetical protein